MPVGSACSSAPPPWGGVTSLQELRGTLTPPDLHWGVPLLSSPRWQGPAPAHPGAPACCTHVEMPIWFTVGCPVLPVPGVGTVVLNARQVIRQGRSSLRLLNLFLLSDLQQCWLAWAALIPVSLPQVWAGSGHQGTSQSRHGAPGPNPPAAQLPSKPQTPWGQRGARGLGVWHRVQLAVNPARGHVVPQFGELVAALRQPSCGFWDAQGVRHTCAAGTDRAGLTGASRCSICACAWHVPPLHVCARGCAHASPPRCGRSLTCNTGASPTSGWRLVGLPQPPAGAVAQPDASSGAKHLLHESSK